ncbi:MAG: helicase RepA family protein [Deltaproteobacteria bacterium]|jgi:hypothetical protein|nr:helicase RepA family protein [Deltaproteobacteria bacterium]
MPDNTISQDRLILQTEQTIIGQILVDPETSSFFMSQTQIWSLCPSDFSSTWEPVFQALYDIYYLGYPITPTNVIERLYEMELATASPIKNSNDLLDLPNLTLSYPGPKAKAEEFIRLVLILRDSGLSKFIDSYLTFFAELRDNISLDSKEKLKIVVDNLTYIKTFNNRENRKTLESLVQNSRLNIMSQYSNSPPDADFIFEGFRNKNVGSIVGPGASGKSFFVLEIAKAVACGKNYPQADLLEIKPGGPPSKVVFFTAEDTEVLLWERNFAIGSFFSPEVKKIIDQNLHIFSTYGVKTDLLDAEEGPKNIETIIRCCHGSRLIIFDPLRCFHTADENDNGTMASLIEIFKKISDETGAAVLFTHHTNKVSTLNKEKQEASQTAARGASSLTDLVRFVTTFFGMSEKTAEEFDIEEQNRRLYAVSQAVKINGAMIPGKKFYIRKEGGVLVPINLTSNLSETKN